MPQQLLGEAREHAHAALAAGGADQPPADACWSSSWCRWGPPSSVALIRRDVPFREAGGDGHRRHRHPRAGGPGAADQPRHSRWPPPRLTRRGMLVQYLNAVESLANVDTVCLDKTGTLTDGNLTLVEVIPLDGTAEERRARTCSAGFAASAAGAATRRWRRSPRRIVRDGGRRRRRGAVLVALEVERACAWSRRRSGWCWARPTCCTADGAHDVIGERQAAGRRVLVFGTAPSAEQPSADGTAPARPARRWPRWCSASGCADDTRTTVEYLQSQGVALKVMSGDSPVTVAAIAGDAGIDVAGGAVEGAALPADDAGAARSWSPPATCSRASQPQRQAPPGRGAAQRGRLRRHDRRRRQRRAGDEAIAAGDRVRQRQPAGEVASPTAC